jgi:hypothetical protein
LCIPIILPAYEAQEKGCLASLYIPTGSLPGHIARSRGHPYANAVKVAGWITLIFGFALWPVTLIWAYVDVPAPRTQGRPQS